MQNETSALKLSPCGLSQKSENAFKQFIETTVNKWPILAKHRWYDLSERYSYLGFYSNKSRGLRKKAGTDDEVAALIDSGESRKSFRKKWAQMVQKVYNVDPLEYPKCHGPMRIISVIEDTEVIKKILKHLQLYI